MGIKESIDGLSEDLREILSSTAAARGPEMAMLSKALAHLGQEKIEEALKMSEQLDQRRDRVIDSVLQIMQGGGR
jgi:hypothetical protein